MQVYKLDITAWTSSFRYPNLISGYQPTLEVPPVSTVLGLINAAAGKYIKHRQLEIGYYFEFRSKQTDMETIYMIEAGDGYPVSRTKSNIINREFLYDTRLILYLRDRELAGYFKNPVYPLLLGRSGDLASVKVRDKPIELQKVSNATKIKGQIIPCKDNFLPGVIQALPKYFTDTIPRNNLGTEAYSIIGYNTPDLNTQLVAYRDFISPDKEVHIYFHQLNFEPCYG